MSYTRCIISFYTKFFKKRVSDQKLFHVIKKNKRNQGEARPLRFAILAALASRARSWARAPPSSSTDLSRRAVLVDCGVRREAGSGSDRTNSTFGVATPSRNVTATRRQEAANQHQRAEARKGKADRTSALSVKPAAANQHQRAEARKGKTSRTPMVCGTNSAALILRRSCLFPVSLSRWERAGVRVLSSTFRSGRHPHPACGRPLPEGEAR